MNLVSRLMIGASLSLFSLTAFGEVKSFTKSSNWTVHELNFLKHKGAEMDAINSAIGECRVAGMQFCVIKAVDHPSVSLNEGKFETRAVVHGYNLDKRIDGTLFSATSSWETPSTSELRSLGVQKDALDKALSNCYQTFQICAFLEVTLVKSGANTDGEAKVLGFNFP